MYPAACEYLWWLSVSVKLRVMTRGEIETVNEDDVGHLRISLLIVIGDLAFRVRRSGYFRDGSVWIEVYEADSLKSLNPGFAARHKQGPARRRRPLSKR
jgi:hypothetical protein